MNAVSFSFPVFCKGLSQRKQDKYLWYCKNVTKHGINPAIANYMEGSEKKFEDTFSKLKWAIITVKWFKFPFKFLNQNADCIRFKLIVIR